MAMRSGVAAIDRVAAYQGWPLREVPLYTFNVIITGPSSLITSANARSSSNTCLSSKTINDVGMLEQVE